MKPYRIFHLLTLAALLFSLFGATPFGARPVSAIGVGLTYTVNTTDDGHDANPGDGYCDSGTGFQLCTLRAAIEESNAHSGLDTIHFGLSGTGLHTMTIFGSPLPAITEQIVLDATTQPNCTVPCIVLSGQNGAGGWNGLEIAAISSTIRGFIIRSFGHAGISISGSSNRIERNYIGFQPGVTGYLGNQYGIYILGGYNTIGGTTAAQRNVISGNGYEGIAVGEFAGYPLEGNTIEGNYIGTNPAGTAARANGRNGITVYAFATGTVIGGTTSGARNVISGNSWSGIDVRGSTTIIQGNFIGTRADGKGSVGNGAVGILVNTSATTTVIGGTTNAARNRIANNHLSGISIDALMSSPASIRRNLIYHNTGLGIDLAQDGVTLNDALDADTGPNGLQNYPIIGSASSTTLVIAGRLNSVPSGTYTIEFFSSPAGTCDPSHHGEGQKFLGSKGVTTDGTGYARIRFVSPLAFPLGAVITATATDEAGNTSEFSVCRTAS